MENVALSLSELISNVADELRLAKNTDANKKSVMVFKECELELKVNIGVEAKAGIKFWLLDIGGAAKKENAHTVKLKFNAIDDNVVAAD